MKENKGHIHAHLMAQYAEDAMVSETPWDNWEFWLEKQKAWASLKSNPAWASTMQYRRKPKTHIVNGVEIPDLRVKPNCNDRYHLADPTESEFTYFYLFGGDNKDKLWSKRGLIYEYTEEGKQAAILHAKAMLGIA